jgi:hypothetical protein
MLLGFNALDPTSAWAPWRTDDYVDIGCSQRLGQRGECLSATMVPGQIALMRMPRGAYSRAALVVSPITRAWRRGRQTGLDVRRSAERGAVDDGTAALGAHLAQLVFHARPHPAQIDRVDTVEDLGGFVGGVAGWNLDAGVVERHVEPVERVDGGLHRPAAVNSSVAIPSVVPLTSAMTTAAPPSANAHAVARPCRSCRPPPVRPAR